MLEMNESEIMGLDEQYFLYKLNIDKGLFWLFDVQKGSCFNLNETSFFILSCFDGKTPSSEILKYYISRYPNEEKEKLKNDYNEIVGTLKNKKILNVIKEDDRGR